MVGKRKRGGATGGRGRKQAAGATRGGEGAVVLEKGHMYFLFRPKIGVEHAESLVDVQKFYIWMAPEHVKLADKKVHLVGGGEGGVSSVSSGGGAQPSAEKKEEEIKTTEQEGTKVSEEGQVAEEKAPPGKKRKAAGGKAVAAEAEAPKAEKHRLIIVGSKKLLDETSRRATFAFVDMVEKDPDEIKKALGVIRYHTETRGERTVDACHIVGEAVYELIRDSEGRCHLFYDLIEPSDATEVQKAFHIHKEGSIMMQCKNPFSDTEKGAFGAGMKDRPHYPAELQEKFKGKIKAEVKFCPAEPELINYKHAQLLLLHSHLQGHDAKTDELITELEQEASKEIEKTVSSGEAEKSESGVMVDKNKIYEETGLSKQENPAALTSWT